MHFVMLMMYHGVLKVVQVMGLINFNKQKYILYRLGNIFINNYRIFINAILTFIFLYVDIISKQTNPTRPDIVLVAIAIYGTCVYVLKTVLALYHHFKWLIF
jgi:hypothetical protein